MPPSALAAHRGEGKPHSAVALWNQPRRFVMLHAIAHRVARPPKTPNKTITRRGVTLAVAAAIASTIGVAASADPGAAPIHEGSRVRVLCVQEAMNYSPIHANLSNDGIFGQTTKAAVEKFQRNYHLTVNGIVEQRVRPRYVQKRQGVDLERLPRQGPAGGGIHP
jgi:peptidoglycan hydrolase-like protein with peptidoglycan-binding domain